MSRNKRLDELRKVPYFAAVDHRLFLDKERQNSPIANLPQDVRRKIKVDAKKLATKYTGILHSIRHSGVGYPIDQLLRDLAIEYTHRYATSGLFNQPINFNYFEPFCAIKLIENSVAPYAEPLPEVDHLFNVADYFDYLTSENAPKFNLAELLGIPEGRTYHFTQNGSIDDFTYMTAEGREFVISGFSMVRRGNSLHWYVLGGEVLSETDWRERCKSDFEIEVGNIPAEKRPFLSQHLEEKGNRIGSPIPLQGTKTAIRTVISGETDLSTAKHLARCYMSETEATFMLFCDDPDVFSNIRDRSRREEIISIMQQRVESAAVMWGLAEAFFQILWYFKFSVTISEAVIKASGKSAPKIVKGGRGVGTQFKHVTSIQISDTTPHIMRSYTPPYYETETDGYWRRLTPDNYGHDRDGNQIKGRTWVKATNKWRARANQPRTVFIKSSVGAAKIQVSDYLKAAELAETNKKPSSDQVGVLYVMRCLAMEDQVYKVGWTSDSAEERARELSSATGVPIPFAVVEVWQHPDPGALEKGVHAMLDPYRLNEGREFFKLTYPELKAIIETEIARSQHIKAQC
ncbi:MAG: GIY-YIG nuclease family protein [Acidocella sp.]|nr:GIY-YIG nuclease family protein [Acidocella sp.]